MASLKAPVETNFTNVNGIRTRYLVTGQGTPMVLIHGGNFGEQDNVDCANNWDLNLETLARHFRVFAIDRLGQGYTDNPKPGGYTIEAVINHLHDSIHCLDLETFHLVGHSRGGYVALRMACDAPGRVKSLTVVDSGTTAPMANVFRDQLRASRPAMPRSREAIENITAKLSFSSEHITKEWMDVRTAIAESSKNEEAVAEVMKIYNSAFVPGLERQKQDTIARIKAGGLQTPTLVAWGRNDPSATLSAGHALYELLASAIAKTEMHIFNQAGHYSYREQPASFSETVGLFARVTEG